MFKNFNQSAVQLAPNRLLLGWYSGLATYTSSWILAKHSRLCLLTVITCCKGPGVINCWSLLKVVSCRSQLLYPKSLRSSTACMCHGCCMDQLHVCVMAAAWINCMYVSWLLHGSTACMCHGCCMDQLHVCVMAAGSD